MLLRLMTVVLAVTLAGCASLHDPAPNSYTGPKALVSDSGFHEDNQKAQLFLLQEVDGKTIDNAIFESRRASQNRGFAVSASYGNAEQASRLSDVIAANRVDFIV